MHEFNGLFTAIAGVIVAVFMAWIVSRDKLSRHQVDTLAREIAKEAVKPFTGGLQMIEDQWNETFERMKLQEGRIAARLRKEEKLLKEREGGSEVADVFAGATPVEAGNNLAESDGSRKDKREAMLKKWQATRTASL